MKFVYFMALIALSLVSCASKYSIDLSLHCTDSTTSYKSYYRPTLRSTTNLHYNYIPCSTSISGQPLSEAIISISDVSGAMLLIRNDAVEVLYRGAYGLNDLRVSGHIVQFLDNGMQVTYNLDTRSFTKQPTGTKGRCWDGTLACVATGIRILATNELVPAIHPRSALLAGNVLYVPDLFGHQIAGYSFPGLQQLWAYDAYYPNDIELLNDGRLLVTEEHSNRIYKLDTATGAKESLLNCGLSVYADLNATSAQIIEAELSGILQAPNGHSICQNRLYSPGSTRTGPNNTFIVSDTDNHRILILDISGNVLTTVNNVNNPTRSQFVIGL